VNAEVVEVRNYYVSCEPCALYEDATDEDEAELIAEEHNAEFHPIKEEGVQE
jgi:hypothetical protein